MIVGQLGGQPFPEVTMAGTSPTSPRPLGEMNVTPMLDVLLVLLIIFMYLALQTRSTMNAHLPTPCAGACDAGPTIVLEVLPGPAYRVNRAPVAVDELARRLEVIYAGRPEKVLQVAGHPGVSYQQVIAAMDAARGAGVRVISLPGRESYLAR
jgi:biopolymer transport protein ExbD